MKSHHLPLVSHQKFSNPFDSLRFTVCSKPLYRGDRHLTSKKAIRGINTVDIIVFTEPGP